MLLLYNLRDLNQSHLFANAIAELLLCQKKTTTINSSAGKALFVFLRMIVKDKKAQLSQLRKESDSPEEDDLDVQLLDNDKKIDCLLDKKLKIFLKQTFSLYCDYSSDGEWGTES